MSGWCWGSWSHAPLETQGTLELEHSPKPPDLLSTLASPSLFPGGLTQDGITPTLAVFWQAGTLGKEGMGESRGGPCPPCSCSALAGPRSSALDPRLQLLHLAIWDQLLCPSKILGWYQLCCVQSLGVSASLHRAL